MNLRDKPKDNWSFLWPGVDDNTIYYEDGTSQPLTTDQVIVPFGQYNGFALAEVSDTSYLNWLLRSAQEKADWFQEKMVTLRLKELE